jgi:hypothetical protein
LRTALIVRFEYLVANRAIAVARNTGNTTVCRFFAIDSSGTTRKAARVAMATDHAGGLSRSHFSKASRSLALGGAVPACRRLLVDFAIAA